MKDMNDVAELLQQVRVTTLDCATLMADVEDVGAYVTEWKTFALATADEAERVLRAGDAHRKDALPKFNSVRFSRFMARTKALPRTTAVEVLARLRSLASLLNDALAFLEDKMLPELRTAIGFVCAAIVELELCMVSAYPDLDRFGDEV